MEENRVSEEEAAQFQKDHDERVEKAREGMGYKKQSEKVETEVEETEEEAPEVEIESEDPTEEVEESEEVETKEEDLEEEPQNRDKSVFRQLNEIRSQKRALESERQQLLDEQKKLKDEVDALKKNLPPPQPFLDFAKSKGINDAKDVKEMYDLFKGQLDQDIGSKLDALNAKIESFETKEVERTEQNAYNESMSKLSGEWKEVLPVIESEYKPNSEQMEKAFELMADLAHEQKYADKELDYILFKEQEKFEEIFGARKRKTLFPARGRASGESKQPTRRDGSHESIMALKKEMDAKKMSSDTFDIIENSRI